MEGDRQLLRTPRSRCNFYPRPPGGGRREDYGTALHRYGISIHALRVEGDQALTPNTVRARLFLSTPSGWRATTIPLRRLVCPVISIHALRVEGDDYAEVQYAVQANFYPRPPGGGRQDSSVAVSGNWRISIHALRVEGDVKYDIVSPPLPDISIHALRVEGDRNHKHNRVSCKISIHALRVEGDFVLWYNSI